MMVSCSHNIDFGRFLLKLRSGSAVHVFIEKNDIHYNNAYKIHFYHVIQNIKPKPRPLITFIYIVYTDIYRHRLSLMWKC